MEQNDHDLLTIVNEKLDNLVLQFTNHLNHHKKYTYFIFTAMFGLIIALILK